MPSLRPMGKWSSPTMACTLGGSAGSPTTGLTCCGSACWPIPGLASGSVAWTGAGGPPLAPLRSRSRCSRRSCCWPRSCSAHCLCAACRLEMWRHQFMGICVNTQIRVELPRTMSAQVLPCVLVGHSVCSDTFRSRSGPLSACQAAPWLQGSSWHPSSHQPQVHCVRAVGHLREALAEVRPTAPVLLHSWCGAAEDVRAIASAHPSAFFSVSGGISALPPAKAIRTLRAIPADRLLLETDAPDGGLRLGPAWLEALPGFARSAPPCPERQEPAGLRRMLALVAAARGEGEVGLAALTWRNACTVFAGLPAAR
ncbi:hypothetical protein ACKKBF_B10295 [Auxenochlorella protothecoides x Auxenochlorella symbiontica]